MSVSVYKGLLIDTREDCTLRAEQGILVIQGHTILERAQAPGTAGERHDAVPDPVPPAGVH